MECWNAFHLLCCTLSFIRTDLDFYPRKWGLSIFSNQWLLGTQYQSTIKLKWIYSDNRVFKFNLTIVLIIKYSTCSVKQLRLKRDGNLLIWSNFNVGSLSLVISVAVFLEWDVIRSKFFASLSILFFSSESLFVLSLLLYFHCRHSDKSERGNWITTFQEKKVYMVQSRLWQRWCYFLGFENIKIKISNCD